MSWLTDLTSKAESLLNKIDQSAADKFNESEISLESPITNISGSASNNELKKQRIGEIFMPTNISPNISPNTPTAQHVKKPFAGITDAPLITKSHSADGKLQGKRSDLSTPEGNKSQVVSKKQDEMLFEFLNNTDTDNTMKAKPPTKLPHKPTIQSDSSLISSRSDTPVEIKLESDQHDLNNKDTVMLTSIKVEDPPPPERTNHTEVQITNNEIIRQHEKEDRMSHLELENQLLKNEVQSLNEELSRTLGHLKEKEDESEKYKMRYENRRNQQNEDYEHIRNEYESKQSDLKEALSAKDSQLAVLRVRIQEVDGELKEKSRLLVNVQTHNEQLMKDHTDASGVQNVALASIREKLEETESQLNKEQLENSSIRSELMDLQEKMHDEQNQYAETIKQLELKQNQEKDKFRDFEVKVKQAEEDAGSANKELNEYKEKAARILQAKEKLISSLKQGKATDLPPILITELEEVKQERDMILEEYTQYKYKMEQLKSDYQELELLHNTDLEDNQQQVESLQVSLQNEISKYQQLEEDMKRHIQELQFNKDELHKLRKSQVIQNQQYEGEIKKLQSQITVKQNTSSSQEELENRIRTLTDSLIHKQTVVEALGTEKNSLVLQLERLEKQYYDIQKSLDIRKKERNNSDIEELDRGGRLQSINSILPSKILHNKHWKSTANEIDKFSVRFGVFLRRYPAARLMVFIYMIILHIWVTFVLLTYTPEIHPHEPPRR